MFWLILSLLTGPCKHLYLVLQVSIASFVCGETKATTVFLEFRPAFNKPIWQEGKKKKIVLAPFTKFQKSYCLDQNRKQKDLVYLSDIMWLYVVPQILVS